MLRNKSSFEPLVIWGASGHARVVADIVRKANRFELVGFLDDVNPQRKGESFDGATILGGMNELKAIATDGLSHLFIAIGDCRARKMLSEFAAREGFTLPTLIHPSATVAEGASIDEGTVIAAGAIVCSATQIGKNVIINTGATIDHECVIANGAHIGPGAHLGGRVIVGESTWIGIGAVVKEKIKVGKESIIGAGAVVVKDVPDGVVAYGVPARVMRKV